MIDDRLTLEDVAKLFPDEGQVIPLPVIPIMTRKERREIEQANPDLDSTPLRFGKYKGQTPDEVADHDPQWLSWAYKNVTNRDTCSEDLAHWCNKQPKKER